MIASTGNPDAHGDSLRTLGASEIVDNPLSVDEPAFFGDQGRHDRSIVSFFLLGCTGLAADLGGRLDRSAGDRLRPRR